MRPKLLFLNQADDFLSESLTAAGFECVFDYSSSYPELIEKIHHYTGIILRSRHPIDAPLLQRAERLRFVARLGVGIEHIDQEAAARRNVVVLNSPEGSRDAVAEHTIGLMLSLFRFIPRANEEIARNIWDRKRNTGREIKGKTVGIMGYGNMGSALAERLRCFGATCIAYDRYRTGFGSELVEEVSLYELWERTDILSLHFPISAENHYFVDAAFLKNFAKPIWLINTARGEILETAAVVTGLREGRIHGAALDVLEYEEGSFANFSFEDLPEDFRFLIESDRVVLTPHLGGITHEAVANHARVVARKILALNLV